MAYVYVSESMCEIMNKKTLVDRMVKVTRAGWFNFEGFGRPYEGWAEAVAQPGWRSAGRAFTRAGARRKAQRLRIVVCGGDGCHGCEGCRSDSNVSTDTARL